MTLIHFQKQVLKYRDGKEEKYNKNVKQSQNKENNNNISQTISFFIMTIYCKVLIICTIKRIFVSSNL